MYQKESAKDFIGNSEEQSSKFDTPRNRQVFFSFPVLFALRKNNICILTQSAFIIKYKKIVILVCRNAGMIPQNDYSGVIHMKTPEFTCITGLVLLKEGDTEMVSCSLLEYLALKAKCEYMSDLRFMHVEERWLREFILRNRDDFTQEEWKEACIYLTGQKASTEDEAIGTILHRWTDTKDRPGMNHRTDMNCRTDRQDKI